MFKEINVNAYYMYVYEYARDFWWRITADMPPTTKSNIYSLDEALFL